MPLRHKSYAATACRNTYPDNPQTSTFAAPTAAMPVTLPRPKVPLPPLQGGGSKQERDEKRRRANTEGDAADSAATAAKAAGKPASSSSGPATKAEDQMDVEEPGKMGKGRGKAGKDKDILHALVRSALSSQQNARTVNGLLIDMWVVKSVDKVAISMMEQGSDYAATVKGGERDLGPPSIWVFGGMLKTLAEDDEAIKKDVECYEKLTVDEKQEHIGHCRIDRMYSADLKRLTMHIAGRNLNARIEAALKKRGADKKVGRAPKGPLERELERHLEALRV